MGNRSKVLGFVLIAFCVAFGPAMRGQAGEDGDAGSCRATILVETTVPCSVQVDDQDLGRLQKYGAATIEMRR